MDNFLLENNRVLWGEKEKHSNPPHVISVASRFSRCHRYREVFGRER